MKPTNHSYRLAALAALLALLVACQPAAEPPATATAQPAATAAPPTAAPAGPTPVPTDTAVPASPTPTPTETPMVAPRPGPADLAGILEALPDLLAEGPGLDGLRATLQSWGALETESEPVREADLDGDGQDEVLLLLAAPAAEDAGFMGSATRAVAALRRDGEGYTLAGSVVLEPAIRLDVTLHDLTGDGVPEAVATYEECGAHTCFLYVQALTLQEGALTGLLAEPASMPYAELALQDGNGDGADDIVLHGGTIGSVGAGPVQTRTEVYAWDGEAIALAETTYDPSPYRVHALYDGDRAMRRGDLEAARDIYLRVATDPDLEEVGFADMTAERHTLEAWARYRLVTVQAALGDDEAAEENLEVLRSDYAGEFITQLAEAFWQAYQEGTDLAAACATTVAYAEGNPQVVESFGYYGYGNAGYTAEDMCLIR